MADTYTLHIAGLTRELPICKVNDHMDIAAFIMFSDVELTEACATALLSFGGMDRVIGFDLITCFVAVAALGSRCAFPKPQMTRRRNLCLLRQRLV